jgi:8-oxo-dGTP pyrophosphatase MutT (NUDIX family)
MDLETVKVFEPCSSDFKAEDCSTNLVGALFLFRKSDQSLLLQLRDEKPNLRHAGMWVPPGGHSESGETIEECTRREFYEETNYFCEQINWAFTLTVQHPQWPTYLLGISWAVFDEKQKIKCQEGQSLKFIKRNEAKTLPIPIFIFPIWNKLQEGI